MDTPLRRGRLKLCAKGYVGPGIPRSLVEDGGVAIIETFRSDPRTLIGECSRWFFSVQHGDVVINIQKQGALAHPRLDYEMYHWFFTKLLEFSHITDCLVLWCDAVIKNIDPSPLVEVRDFYCSPLLDQLWKLARDRQSNPPESCFPKGIITEFGEAKLMAAPGCHNAFKILRRIELLANYEYHKKLAANGPDEGDYVTEEQIAKFIGRSPRTTEKHRKKWPPPDEKGNGNIPDRWILAKHRSRFIELYPDKEKNFPLAPPRNGESNGLHT